MRISDWSSDGCSSDLGQWRWRGQVAADDFDRAGFDAPEQRDEAVDIHDFMQAILKRLMDERMIRHFTIAGQIVLAGDRVRERVRQQEIGRASSRARACQYV